MNLIQKTFIVVALIFAKNTVSAQCKSFTKKNCLPELAPFLSNGQMIAAKLVPGEDATVQLNFNKGISYRLIVCGDPYLQDLNYKLSDTSGTVYTSDTLKSVSSTVDLSVKQTGLLNLNLEVPKNKNANDIIRSGCVTILVGFKDDK